MTYPTAPACYGSAILFRASSVECASCSVALACARTVQRREDYVLSYVERLDALFKTEQSSKVRKWFKSRWTLKKDRTEARALRSATMFKGLIAKKVNLYMLQVGSNPARDGMLHSVFAAMLEQKVFLPRDIVEQVRDTHPSVSKAKLTTYVKHLCEALTDNKVIRYEKKDRKGVYCL